MADFRKAVLASVENNAVVDVGTSFKCLGFAYLLIVLIAMSKGCSTSAQKNQIRSQL